MPSSALSDSYAAHRRRKQRLTRALKQIFCLLIGGIACVGATVLCAAAVTFLQIPTDMLPTVSLIAAGCGAMTAGIFAGYLEGRRGFAAGAIIGILMFVLLLAVSIVTGGFSGSQMIAKLIVMLICAVVGGIIGVNRENSR